MLKKRLQVILIVLALLVFSTNVFAATVGHGAQVISAGIFEEGNFTFNNTKAMPKMFHYLRD